MAKMTDAATSKKADSILHKQRMRVAKRADELAMALDDAEFQLKHDDETLQRVVIDKISGQEVVDARSLVNEYLSNEKLPIGKIVADFQQKMIDAGLRDADDFKAVNEVDAEKQPLKAVSKDDQTHLEQLCNELGEIYLEESNKTPFAMGDKLFAIENAYMKAKQLPKVTAVTLSVWLKDNRKIILSGQRISSLKATAKHFPDGVRSERYSFKQHEQMRKAEPDKDKKGADIIAEYNADPEKLKTLGKTTKNSQPILTIRVRLDDEQSEDADTEIFVNGQKLTDIAKTPWTKVAAEDAVRALVKTWSIDLAKLMAS